MSRWMLMMMSMEIQQQDEIKDLELYYANSSSSLFRHHHANAAHKIDLRSRKNRKMPRDILRLAFKVFVHPT